MRDRRLAANYANALLSLLPEDDQANQADAFLNALAEGARNSEEFRGVLRDPSIAAPDRKAVLFALADQAGAAKTVRNFLGVVADHNRAAELEGIAAEFRAALETRQGIVPVELTTASPLDDGMRTRAADALSKRTGKKVRLTCRVDESLIGGAIARMGSSVYDGSLRTQLQLLRDSMAQG